MIVVIVRPTVRYAAQQVHPSDKEKCNCHAIIKWIGKGHVSGAGITVDGEVAEPLDWIVQVDNTVRIVKAQNFLTYYEIVQDEGALPDEPN